MKKLIFLIITLITTSASADQNELYLKFKNDLVNDKIIKNNQISLNEKPDNIYYLISFSMRDEAIEEIMQQATYYNIPVYINGLINDSMKDTTNKFIKLFGKNSQYGIGIDPTIFEKYSVEVVPTLIVKCDNNFDKLSGNIPLKQAIEKISNDGDCAIVAKKILGEKE